MSTYWNEKKSFSLLESSSFLLPYTKHINYYSFTGGLIKDSLLSVQSAANIHALSSEYFLFHTRDVNEWLYKNRRIYRTVIALLSDSTIHVINKVNIRVLCLSFLRTEIILRIRMR